MTLPDEFEQRIKDEQTAIDLEKAYDEYIDEMFSFDCVGGPFESMVPSNVLEEMDPIASNKLEEKICEIEAL